MKRVIFTIMMHCFLIPMYLFADTVTVEKDDTVQMQIYVQDSTKDTTADTLVNSGNVKKRKAVNYDFAGFGPAWLENLGTDEINYDFILGHLWDVNGFAYVKALLEVAADFTSTYLVSGSLGLNLLLFDYNKDISPYIGGQLGLGIGEHRSDREFGFVAGGSLGLNLFRKSDINLVVEGTAQSLLKDITEDRFPIKYGFRIGILF